MALRSDGPSERDLRLDLFRGVALWLIFLDHIPHNFVNWFTIRNYGFSDATEIFIFISGYTAAFVYGRAMRERGFMIASARILRRAWQIYVAHIFLFTIFMAEIAYVAATFDNPLYAEEMNILDFLKQPGHHDLSGAAAEVQAGQYGRAAALHRAAAAVSADAVAAAAAARFRACGVGGALCADLEVRLESAGLSERRLVLQSVRLAIAVRVRRLVRARRRAAAAPACCARRHRSWHCARLSAVRLRHHADLVFPSRSAAWCRTGSSEWMYPIDKTNLDVLRFAHFLALAALTVRFIPRDWPALQSPCCGPPSAAGSIRWRFSAWACFSHLPAHFVIGEFSGGAAMQVLISLAGILIMIATAYLISWYKKVEGRRRDNAG